MEPTNPTPNSSTPEATPPAGFKLTTLEVTLGLILLIVIVLAWMWALPSYQKVVSQNADLKTQVTELQTHSSKTVTSIPVEVAGKVVYKTVTRIVHDSTSSSQTSEDRTSNKTTVTERGLGTLGVFGGLNNDFALSASHQMIGPIGIGLEGYERDQFKEWSALGGLTLSF